MKTAERAERSMPDAEAAQDAGKYSFGRKAETLPPAGTACARCGTKTLAEGGDAAFSTYLMREATPMRTPRRESQKPSVLNSADTYHFGC